MSRTSATIAVVAFVGIGAAAAYWGPGLLDDHGDRMSTERCTVSTADASYSLTAEQTDNAAVIAAVGRSYGFDAVGVTVALATAIQESSLRNLDYGDRDSVGLFQQRPSQGWGSVEEILDRHYSASRFYEALAGVDGWQNMRVTEAAQAVQRSGFPEAYADHEAEARAWAHALEGIEGSLVCDIADAQPGSAADLTARVTEDLGAAYSVEVLGNDGDLTVLGIRPYVDDEPSRKVAQSWAIATASTTSVVWVENGSERWERSGKVSQAHSEAGPPDYPGVRIAIKTAPEGA